MVYTNQSLHDELASQIVFDILGDLKVNVFNAKLKNPDVSCEVLGFVNASTFLSLFCMDLKGKKNHNILVSMLDPTFKNICLVIKDVKYENATRLVVFYMNNYSSC